MLLGWLGLVGYRAAMIASRALSVWDVIITRMCPQSNIPLELYDAGQVGGVSSFHIPPSIVIPLSGPITGIVLFYAVGNWNLFFSALICLKRR